MIFFLNKNVFRWVMRGLIIATISVVIVLLISSYHYRLFELNPVVVWHGVDMEVRSLLADSQKNSVSVDSELIARVSEQLAKGQLNYAVQAPSDLSQITQMDFELKNQIAANQTSQAQLKKKIERLERANQQRLNFHSNLGGLSQNNSSIVAYNTEQAVHRAALVADFDVPTEAQAQALIANRRQSNISGKAIPQRVLNNVQKTTGISPNEIKELMNR